MKINVDPVISSRIRAAWAQISPEQRARIMPAILRANDQAVQVVTTAVAPQGIAMSGTLTLAYSVLTEGSNAVVSNLEAGIVITVGPDGVIWGTGKWEQLDPGWAEAFAVFLESLLPIVGGKHPFVTTPRTIQIPDRVTIGLVGDWGTGDWRFPPNLAPSTLVRKQIASLKPDVTIHLGDVYYAGTADQEKHLLVGLWPGSFGASFALNSNHEMYSGGKPYYEVISNAPFNNQGGCSYFSVQNNHWVVIGLDSAYFSSEDDLYTKGMLFPADKPNMQNDFLARRIIEAQMSGKKLILLTHHNGLDDTGSKPNALFDQVTGAFPSGGGPDYWYWGHEHLAAVYKGQGPAGTLCRCCGHGALPWGQSSDLIRSPQVVWHERRCAKDPDIPDRVFNGFAMLTLDGPNIAEAFYDETGGVAWSSF